MDEDMPGEIRDLDAPDRGMERGGVRRVPDPEADDQDARWIVQREQWNVSEGTHVALSQRTCPRHRVPVGQQGPSLVRRFRHGNHFGHAFAEGEQPPFAGRQHLRPPDDVVRGELQPQRKAKACRQRRGEHRRQRRTRAHRVGGGRRA
jgi:hypothetical protein